MDQTGRTEIRRSRGRGWRRRWWWRGSHPSQSGQFRQRRRWWWLRLHAHLGGRARRLRDRHRRGRGRRRRGGSRDRRNASSFGVHCTGGGGAGGGIRTASATAYLYDTSGLGAAGGTASGGTLLVAGGAGISASLHVNGLWRRAAGGATRCTGRAGCNEEPTATGTADGRTAAGRWRLQLGEPAGQDRRGRNNRRRHRPGVLD